MGDEVGYRGCWGVMVMADLCVPTGSLAQKAEQNLKIQNPVQVQEGLCAYVPCSFTLPRAILSTDKLSGAWYREGSHIFKDGPVATSHPGQELEGDAWNHFLFLGNISEHNCSLVIRNARKQDHGKYFFSVKTGESQFIYSQDLLILNVTSKEAGGVEQQGCCHPEAQRL